MSKFKSKEKSLKAKKERNRGVGAAAFIYGVIIAVIFAIILIMAEKFVLATISFVFIIGLAFVISELYYDISDLNDKLCGLRTKINDLDIDEITYEVITKKAAGAWTCSCGVVNEEHVILCENCGKIKSDV